MEPYTTVYKVQLNLKEYSPCAYANTLSELLCVVRAALLATLAVFLLCVPLGDPHVQCEKISYDPAAPFQPVCVLCRIYLMCRRMIYKFSEMINILFCYVVDVLYKVKLKVYLMIERWHHNDLCAVCRQHSGVHKNEGVGTRDEACKCRPGRCCKK